MFRKDPKSKSETVSCIDLRKGDSVYEVEYGIAVKWKILTDPVLVEDSGKRWRFRALRDPKGPEVQFTASAKMLFYKNISPDVVLL